MQIKAKKYTLKNGIEISIRSLLESDAEELIKHRLNVDSSTIFMNRLAEETQTDLEKTKTIIDNYSKDQHAAFIGAFINNQVVGSFAIRPISDLSKIKHRGSFGIAVNSEYRGMGIGKILVSTMIETAKKAGLEQVELEVVSTNYAARKLYSSFGFVEIGHIPNAYKLPDGQYLDFEIMVLLLNK